MITKGSVVLVQLIENIEVIGEWADMYDEFIEIAKAAQIVLIPMVEPHSPNKQPRVQKTIMPVSDSGKFGDTLYVWRDKIISVKEILESSSVYGVYKQSVSGLVMPTKGIVVPFIKPGGSGGDGVA
jgi:hypothetical protein